MSSNSKLFKVLNTPENDNYRQSLPGTLGDFHYVNGGLFSQELFIPEFGKKARRVILECGALDWKTINPDIFGSMFQSVVDPKERGNLGQHYTSVPNIMKVIQPLFLDKLYEELEKSKNSVKKLKVLILRLERIRIFDPACGSGNFLIIAYKELRRFEMHVFEALNKVTVQSVMFMSSIKLSQFYGIEIDDFAHEIALLSLWLAEHQMNVDFRAKFGHAEPDLPLKDAGNVVAGNSLRLDWEEICPKCDSLGELEVYICGNPPFAGDNKRNSSQRQDMDILFHSFKKYKRLDYVSCWFWKGANYISTGNAEIGLVATNSICQGVQVEMIWKPIFELGIYISYAYQSFPWRNNAKDKAAVHVVVIGLTKKEGKRTLFNEINHKLISLNADNINGYLVVGKNITCNARTKPISNVPPLIFGNKPTDGGFYMLTTTEKNQLLEKEPGAERFIHRLYGSEEFINGKDRWCIWLKDASQADINALPLIKERVEKVDTFRKNSSSPITRTTKRPPHLFIQLASVQNEPYILIPSVSSENRDYIPMGFMPKDVISNNRNYLIPNGSLYEFGILNSEMHMDWMRMVGGRLESRYSYSVIIYNNFIFPDPNQKQRANIETLSKEIILIRSDYELEGLNLAKMYDPEKMPSDLLEAHKTLDIAVEKLYRDKTFKDSSERLQFLFSRYEQLIEAEKQANT